LDEEDGKMDVQDFESEVSNGGDSGQRSALMFICYQRPVVINKDVVTGVLDSDGDIELPLATHSQGDNKTPDDDEQLALASDEDEQEKPPVKQKHDRKKDLKSRKRSSSHVEPASDEEHVKAPSRKVKKNKMVSWSYLSSDMMHG
jgi:hypothetical protein